MPIGFRVRTRFERTRPDLVEAFRALPVADVSDSMSRLAEGGRTFGRCIATASLRGRR